MAMAKAERVAQFQARRSLTGGASRLATRLQLATYTLSTLVFGMICSALGPAIPWLAGNAGVAPEALGWLPAAQALMCIVSGLASSSMAYVPRRYHHRFLFAMMLWLGLFFTLLPRASGSLGALAATFALQVLPRPWIGQMTNLLVSELYEDPSLSSAAQSFNQGGFALGCVIMVLLEQLSAATFGTQAMFYLAGGFTALSSLLFLALPRLEDKQVTTTAEAAAGRGVQLPSAFTLVCAGLGVLAVGLEVACGTWLITSMTQTGFSSGVAAACNVTFWVLFAVSRLALAPCICRCLRPRPAAMVIGGAAVALTLCIPAAIWPTQLPAVLVAVSGIAVGAGPTYAMTISMAKERRELTSVDSAMFAIASSLGAGGVPFVMSRIMSLFGATAFFPTLLAMCLVLVAVAAAVDGASRVRMRRGAEAEAEVTKDLEAADPQPKMEMMDEDAGCPVPPTVWTYWEQGWQQAPPLCQACAESWELANPDLTVRKISAADLPELLPELCAWPRFEELPPAQRADLVRLALLQEFGGIWADATLFCAAPVMPWLQELHQKADRQSKDFFFVFDRSDSYTWPHDPFLKSDLLISNWFLASTPGHPLTVQWLAVFRQEVTQTTLNYAMHDTFRAMVQDADAQQLYAKMPRVSARHPHLLEFELGFATPAVGAAKELLRQSLQVAPMQKLSHKILQEKFLRALCKERESGRTLLGELFSRREAVRRKLWLRKASAESMGGDLVQREEAQKTMVHSTWKTCLHVPAKGATGGAEGGA